MGERIIRASIVVGIAHLILKFFGLIQAMVAGNYMDQATYAAVYAFAFEGIIYSAYLIGEEAIGPSFLPVFMKEKDEKEESAGWALANIVLTLQAILLLGTILVIVCFPEVVVRLFTYWDEAVDPTAYNLAVQSLPWLAPSLLFLSLGSTTYMLLNGYKHFFLAAIGDASWKFCVILFMFVGMGLFGMDYMALVFGLLVGSIAKLLTHMLGLLRQLRFVRPSLDLKSPALRTLLWLMLPLLAGILFAKARDIYNNITILSYLKQESALLIQANSFGRKLFQGLSWLVPYAVSIAMFPFLCELVDRKDWKKLGELLTQSTRMLLSFFIPVSLLLAALSEPIAVLLFARGEVSVESARLAGLAAACYMFVLPAFALEYVFMQGYFANRKMISVTVIGIVYSALSIGISYIFVRLIGLHGTEALLAVILGYVISRMLKTLTLVTFLKRTIPMLPVRDTLLFLGRLSILAAITGAGGWVVMLVLNQLIPVIDEVNLSKMTKLLLFGKLVGAGTAGLIAYVVFAYLLRIAEPFTMFRWGFDKVRAKLGR